MKKFLIKRPWIWVIVAFVVLIGAWTTLIRIALNNQPEKIPLEHLQEETGSEQADARD